MQLVIDLNFFFLQTLESLSYHQNNQKGLPVRLVCSVNIFGIIWDALLLQSKQHSLRKRTCNYISLYHPSCRYKLIHLKALQLFRTRDTTSFQSMGFQEEGPSTVPHSTGQMTSNETEASIS